MHHTIQETIVQHLLKSGCPKSKLVLGVPAFGRSYTLFSSYSTGLGALVKGLGKAGNLSQSEGFLGYNEVMNKIIGLESIKTNLQI